MTVNSVLYVMSITQSRDDPRAQSYLTRKSAEGKTKREARLAHQRQLASCIIRRVWRDAHHRTGTTTTTT